MPDEKNATLLREAKERYKKANEAASLNRSEGVTDLKMLLGGEHQWDEQSRAARKDRPMLTINKLPKFVRQITGNQRQNRPSGKVRPVDSQSDPETAKVIEGLIRNIEYSSNAPYAYDNAFKYAAAAGIIGYWRILTDYVEDSFDQDISIQAIRNPLTVTMDHDCIPYQGKERFAFVTERIPKEEFDRLYPKQDGTTNWEDEAKNYGVEWLNEDGVIIAEYFYREATKKKLYLLETGETVDDAKIKALGAKVQKIGTSSFVVTLEQTISIIKERECDDHKIMWCKMTGADVLEGPKEWAGKFIPIIPVFPEEWVIDGKTHMKGAIRDARDPQKVYNYTASQNVESIALAPKSPFIVGSSQIQGNEQQWKNAHRSAYPYLVYNDQNNNGQAPRRADPATVQPALVQAMQQCNMDLHDTTGIYPSSLGSQDDTGQSGRAILAKQKEADTGTFEYIDNLSYAIQFTWKALIDLIPRIFDTERLVRVLGQDETDRFVSVNAPTLDDKGNPVIYDLSSGKYDVAITAGPSYATQRMEAAEAMTGIMQALGPAAPAVAPIILPRLFKMYDWPEAQDIAEELQQALSAQMGGMGQPGMPPQPGPAELSPQEMVMAGQGQGVM